MFLSSLEIPSSAYVRSDYLQATESAGLELMFERKLAALISENAERLRVSTRPLNVLAVELAGGADGTFVVSLLLSDARTETGWNADDLSQVRARFWMGADAESLDDYQEAAIASLRSASTGLAKIVIVTAGAARGARFMAMLAGKRTTGETP